VLATVEQAATHRLATARLQHRPGVVCDLIFATSGIEPEIVDGAASLALFQRQTPVLRLLNTIAEGGFARGQNLVDKWADLRARLGS